MTTMATVTTTTTAATTNTMTMEMSKASMMALVEVREEEATRRGTKRASTIQVEIVCASSRGGMVGHQDQADDGRNSVKTAIDLFGNVLCYITTSTKQLQHWKKAQFPSTQFFSFWLLLLFFFFFLTLGRPGPEAPTSGHLVLPLLRVSHCDTKDESCKPE